VSIAYHTSNATIQYHARRVLWEDAFPTLSFTLNIEPERTKAKRDDVPLDWLFPEQTAEDSYIESHSGSVDPTTEDTNFQDSKDISFQSVACFEDSNLCCNNCSVTGFASIAASSLSFSDFDIGGSITLALQQFTAWLDFSFVLSGSTTVPLFESLGEKAIGSYMVSFFPFTTFQSSII
jgi:hypothetical protein